MNDRERHGSPLSFRQPRNGAIGSERCPWVLGPYHPDDEYHERQLRLQPSKATLYYVCGWVHAQEFCHCALGAAEDVKRYFSNWGFIRDLELVQIPTTLAQRRKIIRRWYDTTNYVSR